MLYLYLHLTIYLLHTAGAISSQSIFWPHLLCVISAANTPPTIFFTPGKYESFPQIALAIRGNCPFVLKTEKMITFYNLVKYEIYHFSKDIFNAMQTRPSLMDNKDYLFLTLQVAIHWLDITIINDIYYSKLNNLISILQNNNLCS